ncbi:hypothetical protein AB1N83_012174, partial [Pleurotus pulmonarius]
IITRTSSFIASGHRNVVAALPIPAPPLVLRVLNSKPIAISISTTGHRRHRRRVYLTSEEELSMGPKVPPWAQDP